MKFASPQPCLLVSPAKVNDTWIDNQNNYVPNLLMMQKRIVIHYIEAVASSDIWWVVTDSKRRFLHPATKLHKRNFLVKACVEHIVQNIAIFLPLNTSQSQFHVHDSLNARFRLSLLYFLSHSCFSTSSNLHFSLMYFHIVLNLYKKNGVVCLYILSFVHQAVPLRTFFIRTSHMNYCFKLFTNPWTSGIPLISNPASPPWMN